MSRTTWTTLVVAGVVLVAAVVLELATRKPAPAAPAPVALPDPEAPAQEGLRTQEVVLYFASPDGSGLVPQKARIFETRALLDRMKQTVVTLVRGPAADSDLLPVLPPETPLRDLFLDATGVVYLDLGQELVRGLPAGSAAELLAVGSLANTLTRNFPEVRSIRILIDGEEVNTLGGHLDLTRAMEADPSLILPEEE